VLWAIAVAAALLLAAIWWTRPAPAGSSRVAVGAKDFTESVLLGEIVAQMLEAQGVTVERKFELGGNLCHESLRSGELDVYPEYTGTAFTAILKHPPVTDPTAVYEQVKREYAANFNLEVGPPLGFSNDFAILVRAADAQRLNLKTISDAAPHAPGWRAGFGQDFMSRADGYAGFAKTYGLRFAAPPREMDLSLTYRALAAGEVDIIAGNSTDGLIAALNLVQLQDDRRYFPPYEAVLLARRDTLERVPQLAEVLQKLARALTTDEMRRLNYAVDGEKRDRAEGVREWLARRP
jgi:glycine betaine/choline ABC-type transport system substrate-binding protein